jgi:hypothetical protein
MRTPIVLASLLTVLLGTAACGSSEEPAGAPAAPPEPQANVVELVGDEYGYLMPAAVKGGWTTLRLDNRGDEPHEFALAKLTGGKTVADVRRYLADPKSQEQPPPAWVQIRPGLPTLAAGETAALTQALEPGRYVLLCFLDAPDGRSHIEHGMLREFEVEGDAGVDPPTADATLELGPELAAPRVEAGLRTLELRNTTEGPGSVFLTAFEPGKTEKDLARWEENGLRGPAPATFLGGTIDVPPGSSVYLTVNLEAGREYTLFDDVNGLQLEFTPS